jgi:hypothetical protein
MDTENINTRSETFSTINFQNKVNHHHSSARIRMNFLKDLLCWMKLAFTTLTQTENADLWNEGTTVHLLENSVLQTQQEKILQRVLGFW